MIPKIIHYCWFGDKPKPHSVLRCIESWKKHCPDFEIREWTERDCDVAQNKYTRQAYEAKAWGFVPDYIRLWIIYHHGGIYLDTDVQIIRSISPLLKEIAFCGFEKNSYSGAKYVNFGQGFGAEKNNPVIKAHMNIYQQLKFMNEDGSLNRTPSQHYTTRVLEKYGLNKSLNEIQRLPEITVYPEDYFCPKDFVNGLVQVTKNTYSIHHFDASWYDEDMQQRKIARWKTAKQEYVLDYLLHLPNHILIGVLGKEKYAKLKKHIKGE